ncbi:ABC transporter [Salpingoeca rosetta]|uniref:ABC transporter n=1 Tax=Salpingoeca rosetta (strain ATCC 50818 / BSB-021) TaxID=946362 RepID=F2UPM1_SALR5|nr:ABC transporter [Salpingoeca rosetta]EGD79576.1 ABC transporter [Salpingoeca rosetta]|eukprot:XP_004988804.1 ABC transporter [Salpingoeca rosetta]
MADQQHQHDEDVTIVDVDSVVPSRPSASSVTTYEDSAAGTKRTTFSTTPEARQSSNTSVSNPQQERKEAAARYFDGDEDLVFDPRLLEASTGSMLGGAKNEHVVEMNGDGGSHGQPSFADVDSTRHPTVLQFSDVKYEVDVTVNKQKTVKPILKGLSGQVKPGQVLAIMGASGAGKTTLLNMLAGRLSAAGHGRSSGSILVNGQKRNFNTFRQISAYVLQQDSFFATLTVRETITLSAMLRLPASMTQEEKLMRVDSVIAELGLAKCADTFVGNELIRGVSGGEKKRVNVGTELVTNPSLVFLDEPTSGLDSFNAQNVMQTLLTLAKSNRTIIATIHQPRSSIFQMFDLLLLLSEGHTMYFGPAADAVGYFGSIGYGCPDEFNPADYFLDLVSLDQRNPRALDATRKRISFLSERFEEHQQRHPVVTDVSDVISQHEKDLLASNSGEGSGRAPAKYNTSFLRQFVLLYQRSLKAMAREKIDNIARLGQTVVFSIILGIIWLNEGGSGDSSSVQAIAGAMFFLLINQSFSGIFGILFIFPVERAVVLKERASRSYHVGAYFSAKTVAEMPRSFLLNLLFSIVTYFMVGLRGGADHFFLYVLTIFLVSQTAEGIALIVSAIADDPQQAGAISPIFIVTSMLFGGFFIGVDQIPAWLAWLKHLSFLKYGFAAIMQNEFEGRMLDASCATTVAVNGTASGAGDDLCFATGEEVLDFYNLSELSLGANMGVLLGLIVGFRLISYWILRRNGPVYDTAL